MKLLYHSINSLAMDEEMMNLDHDIPEPMILQKCTPEQFKVILNNKKDVDINGV